MKRPSFQFYPSDWVGNSNLKRCTHAEKGVWLEIMCLLHDSEEYGLLRWPLKEIIEAVKCKPADAKALVSKGVLKGSDTQLDAAFVYTPRSGRKDGEPVTLVPTQAGPVWFSSRMVKDEYVRTIRGESTRFGDESGEAPSRAPKPPFGDGSSSSSSSSSSNNTPKPPAASPDGFAEFWRRYPKKVGKPAAEKAFRAAKLNGHLPEVLADVKAKASSAAWTKDGGQFVPNPATYLNQRRWEDLPTSASDQPDDWTRGAQ